MVDDHLNHRLERGKSYFTFALDEACTGESSVEMSPVPKSSSLISYL